MPHVPPTPKVADVPANAAPTPGAPHDDAPTFEDLTLSEALGAWVRAPRSTWRALVAVASLPREDAPAQAGVQAVGVTARAAHTAVVAVPVAAAPTNTPPHAEASLSLPSPDAEDDALPQTRTDVAVVFALRLLALLLAWGGNVILVAQEFRTGALLARGAPLLALGFVVWLGAEAYAHRRGLAAWWRGERAAPRPAPPLEPDAGVNLLLMVVGLALSAGALVFTLGNHFTLVGALAWFASIAVWAFALGAPVRWAWPRVRWRAQVGTVVALVLIVGVGAFFRLSQLADAPPQMTSDHVEKLLDSQRVLQGQTQVFFPNNGGREPAQMYLMALLSQLPGAGMNFTTLKVLSVLEGLLTLPLLWWLGREVFGPGQRRLGTIVGLVLAALVALSYWHTSLSRLALRIVLTPMVTTALLIFLVRAFRHNRRNDWLRAGLVLGFGLYTYQAVRMLPLVVVVAVAVHLVSLVRARAHLRRAAGNFAVLVLMAAVVFVPMAGVVIEFPQYFWMRTAGRLLGDSLVVDVDTGLQRQPTPEETREALRQNVRVLGQNTVNALLMFNWKGDVAWINGAPNAPALSAVAGALLVLGVASWLVWGVRTRASAGWLVPLTLVLMLLPSILSIAYPIENPSATRTSGALPSAFLLAALPLALLARDVRTLLTRRTGVVASVMLVVVVLLVSYVQDANTYFGQYAPNYLRSSLPYRQGGSILRTFNEETGTRGGNAFMVAYPYWWDHRALGLEGGMVDWPNGVFSVEDVPSFLNTARARTGRYVVDPEADLLFFFSSDDLRAVERLAQWFPNGQRQTFVVAEQARTFEVMRVPALGNDRFARFVMGATAPAGGMPDVSQ